MDDNNNEHSKSKLNFLTFLIIILILELSFITYNQYKKLYSTDITGKTLIVQVQYIDDENEDVSDSTQITNALNNGGMIIIKLDGDWLDDKFGSIYRAYGASDSDGMIFILGGLINYISNNGWTLIQAPTSALNNSYYFIK